MIWKYFEIPMIKKALWISEFYHRGGLDKNNIPYIVHVLDVCYHCFNKYKHRLYAPYSYDGENNEFIEKCVCICILHDIVEDTLITLKDLEQQHFPQDIIDAIDAITRRKDEKYYDYIRRCKKCKLASIVKVCDLERNLTRCNNNKEQFEYLISRYKDALDILTNDSNESNKE